MGETWDCLPADANVDRAMRPSPKGDRSSNTPLLVGVRAILACFEFYHKWQREIKLAQATKIWRYWIT
jgi:hypothetical protein